MNSDFEWRKNDLLDIITKLDDERILNIIYCFVIGVTNQKLNLEGR